MRLGFIFCPTLPYLFEPEVHGELTAHDLSNVIMQYVNMRLLFAKLVQDELLWSKSLYFFNDQSFH